VGANAVHNKGKTCEISSWLAGNDIQRWGQPKQGSLGEPDAIDAAPDQCRDRSAWETISPK
jgi:hypothetical protein